MAGTGSLTQPDNSRFVTTTGDIRLVAQVDILLGGLTTTGNASLTATTGSILDSGDAFGGEDVIANGLHLFAGTGIGLPTDHLETLVTTLTARATSGGIYLTETDALIVDDVAVTIQRVNADATVTAVTAAQSDVATTAGNGSIVLQTLNGSITLNDGTVAADNTAVGAHGTGDILLEAIAAGTNITINADVNSGSGHITVLAPANVTLTATADVRTGGTGTIDVIAGTGAFTQDDDSRLISGTGDIRVHAHTSIYLGGLTTGGKRLAHRRDRFNPRPG